MSERILTGSVTVFEDAIASVGVKPVLDMAASVFGGISVIEDKRLPPGVWAIVPHGKTLMDEGVQIGPVSAEHAPDAQGFAMAARYLRANAEQAANK